MSVASIESERSMVRCDNCGASSLEQFPVHSDNVFHRCPECLLYQKPNQPPATHYEQSYHQCYEKRRPKKVTTAITRLAALTKYLPDDRPKMLDIGCSIGATVEAGQRLGWRSVGVDVSQVAVDFCRQRGLDCHKVDGIQLPFEDASFDVVTSWHVIEHVDKVSQTLQEWYRILKPGGVLVLETPDSQCLKARRLGAAYESFWPHGHLYTFTRSNMCQYLSRTGFEVLPSRVLGKLSTLPLHLALYATAYRSLRQAYRKFGWCKSIEVCCRKPKS